MIQVIIVENDPQFRQNLRTVLGESGRPTDVIEMAQMLHPDVVLLNGDLAACDAFETVWLLRYYGASVGVIILTQFPDEERLFQWIKVGANAYTTCTISPEVLIETVRRVSSGEFLFSFYSP